MFLLILNCSPSRDSNMSNRSMGCEATAEVFARDRIAILSEENETENYIKNGCLKKYLLDDDTCYITKGFVQHLQDGQSTVSIRVQQDLRVREDKK